MYLSMFFETTFPIFEKIRDKYTLNIGNPRLYLHMCGTPQPTRMANMNVGNIGMSSSRDEPSTTHNSTHFLTCVVYVLCIRNPRIDMCGHVCHMSTQLFKKCVSKLCIFTEFNQK